MATMITSTFTAKEAKNNFGRLLDEARRVPVTIEKNGRKVAVMLSLEEYNFLETLSDAYWLKRARQAGKAGFIGVKKSQKLLEKMLHARR